MFDSGFESRSPSSRSSGGTWGGGASCLGPSNAVVVVGYEGPKIDASDSNEKARRKTKEGPMSVDPTGPSGMQTGPDVTKAPQGTPREDGW